MNNIYFCELKKIDILKELQNIGFDESYIEYALKKQNHITLKFINLKSIEANILKQTALSVGTDCAVNRNVILNSDKPSDCLITASEIQFLEIAKKISMQQFRMKEISNLIKNHLKSKVENIQIKDKTFNFKKNKYIMGILNITPNSFSDGGKYCNTTDAIKKFEELYEDGADIIDIGAESTRPNYEKISSDEEILRIKDFFKNIDLSDKITSIDTQNYKTAEFAFKNGVNILNSVNLFNNNLISFVKDVQCPFVLMFNEKAFNTDDITQKDIMKFFVDKIEEIISKGIKKENIIIDLGFGFFKDNNDNYKFLSELANFQFLKQPILLGISRKSFIDKTKNNDILDEKTLLLTSKLIENVNILRVHNVKKHKMLLNLFSNF